MNGQDFIRQLPGPLFWDVDPLQLDAEQHARFIIVRVMDRGTPREVKLVNTFYGADRIKTCLLEAPALEPRTIAYFAEYFDVERSAFRATRRQKQLHTHT